MSEERHTIQKSTTAPGQAPRQSSLPVQETRVDSFSFMSVSSSSVKKKREAKRESNRPKRKKPSLWKRFLQLLKSKRM